MCLDVIHERLPKVSKVQGVQRLVGRTLAENLNLQRRTDIILSFRPKAVDTNT